MPNATQPHGNATESTRYEAMPDILGDGIIGSPMPENDTSPEMYESMPLTLADRIIGLTLVGLSICCMLMGITMLGLAIRKGIYRRNMRDAILVSMSVADATSVSVTSVMLISTYSRGQWTLGEVGCHANAFLCTLLFTVSMWHQWCLAAQRYLAVIHRINVLKTATRTALTVLFCWIIPTG